MVYFYFYFFLDPNIPIILQKVKEPIRESSVCSQVYPIFNASINVCAGGEPVSGSGTCNGDSGGPLQCRAVDQSWVQVGITSYGTPMCGLANDPDVFTRVSAYVDWINNTLTQNTD